MSTVTTEPTAMTAGSPEEVEAEAKLALVPAELHTDDLRATVLESARRQAQHRIHGERHDAISADLTQAIHAADHDAAEGLAGRLHANRLVTDLNLLPSTDLDPAVIGLALNRAERLLNTDVLSVTIIRPRYLVECEVWENLPVSMRVAPQGQRPPVEHPKSIAEDLAAVELFDRVVAQGRKWHEGFAAWKDHAANGTGEPLSLLTSSSAYRSQVAEFRQVAEEASAVIQKANGAHWRAGLNWKPPFGVDVPGVAELRGM